MGNKRNGNGEMRKTREMGNGEIGEMGNQRNRDDGEIEKTDGMAQIGEMGKIKGQAK